MKVGRFAAQLKYSLAGVLVLGGLSSLHAGAQHDQAHALMSQHQPSPDQRKQTSAFVRLVRESTERYRDVAVAEADGYALQFGCVSGSDTGAMGLHYVKGAFVGDDVRKPRVPDLMRARPADGCGSPAPTISSSPRPGARSTRRRADGPTPHCSSPNRFGCRRSTRCVWVEGPQRHVRQLAPRRLMRRVQQPELIRGNSRQDGEQHEES